MQEVRLEHFHFDEGANVGMAVVRWWCDAALNGTAQHIEAKASYIPAMPSATLWLEHVLHTVHLWRKVVVGSGNVKQRAHVTMLSQMVPSCSRAAAARASGVLRRMAAFAVGRITSYTALLSDRERVGLLRNEFGNR
jgi:hypothetical protein